MVTIHLHDRHGHRILDAGGAQGLQPKAGTAYGGVKPTGKPPQRAKAIDEPQQSAQGMSHQMAAQQHEAAAQHHVGLNWGQQNPVSRAHTEAAKAHKTAMGLLGKPGYEQARSWALSASQHAGRLAGAGQRQAQTPQPAPRPSPQPTQPAAPAADYGTAEGAQKRNQGVSRPGAAGYNNPARAQYQSRPQATVPTGQSSPTPRQLHPAERQRMASRLAHLQQQSANPFAGRQHAAEMQQLRSRLSQHDAVSSGGASPRAPGTPKPPQPPKPKAPPSPKPAASAAPQKPPQPKPPGATPPKPAPKPPARPGVGAAVGGVAHAVTRPVEAVEGAVHGLNAIQRWGEGLRDRASRDAGTSLGGRRGHSTRRHLQAEDEAKKRRSWFGDWRSIDAWFHDFDESKVNRGKEGSGKGGQFLPKGAGGGGASAQTKSEPEKKETKSRAERRFTGEHKGRPPGRGAQQQQSSTEGEGEKAKKATKKESPAKSLYDQQEKIVTPEEFYDPANGHLSQDEVNAIAEVKEKLERGYLSRGKGVDTQRVHKPGGKLEGRPGHEIYKGGEYTASRKRKHAEILRDLFSPAKREAATPAEGQKPAFVMLGGRGGSGKSNFTDGIRYPDGHRDPPIVDKTKHIYIDSDEIKKALGSQGWDAALYHEEASDLVDRALAYARDRGLNTILDATMKTAGSAEKKLDEYEKAGFDLKGYYMHTPLAKAARNSVDRFKKDDWKGRFVPPEYILTSTTNEETFDKLRHRFSDWSVYVNRTGRDPRHYASKGDED